MSYQPPQLPNDPPGQPNGTFQDPGGVATSIEAAGNFNVFAERARWNQVRDKAGLVAYVAQRTGGKLDYSYLREVTGTEGARDLLRQAALQPHVGPAAKQVLREVANQIAAETYHHPPGQ